MVSGLLMELDDHNCWTIAEAIGHCGPHRLRHLLPRAVWDDQQVADIAAAWAAGHLDDGDAVLIVDETADEKSSARLRRRSPASTAALSAASRCDRWR
jgi:SRSO17 transposase